MYLHVKLEVIKKMTLLFSLYFMVFFLNKLYIIAHILLKMDAELDNPVKELFLTTLFCH